ncbi:MAG: hypothetical protein IKA05_08205, partial [Clostridia bacterium]|nr:hypothetical protein [Clostridia bacterium]
TYTVTPFFVETEGGEAAYGRTWTVNYDADGDFVDQSIVEPEPEDDDTALYSIVYPADSVMAPAYTVVALQYHILSKRGIKMPLATERSEDPDAYEIVIVEDTSMEPGTFTTAVEGNRLIVTAGDTFGYIAASQRLVKQLFPSGRIKLNDGCNTNGVYSREMIQDKIGETRVIFQNVWIRDQAANSPLFNNITGYQYQLALVALYQPDVIGFNEFFGGNWRTCGFIEAMAEIGYVEAKPIVNGKTIDDLGDTLFYNTNTTELVENSARYLSYGNYKSVDTDGDGISEAVKRNTGEFAGRYYDNSDYRWLCASVATFKDKTSLKEYSVCCTHFESNGALDPQIAPLGNALRMEQIEKLLPFLNAYQEEFGRVLLIGGDYNSADSYDYKTNGYSAKGDTNPWYFDWADKRNNHKGGYAESWDDHKANPNKALTVYDWHDGTQKEYLWGVCDELRANGFLNCREQTRDTAFNNSCNGYPTWNAELQAYVGFSSSLTDSAASDAYSGSIDHIYARETFEGELETLRYRNLSIETILSSSDHKPVLIDFNLREEGEGGNEDEETTPWQGMNDYAAPTKGFGTKENPFRIENAQHLAWLSRMVEDAALAAEFSGRVEEARKVFAGLYFQQTADIDLNNMEFMSIGSYMGASSGERHLFGGIYDGNGFKIMNAKVSMADHVGKDYYKNTVATTYAPPADPSVEGAVGHYDALFNVSAGAILQNITAVNVHTGNYDAEHTGSTAAGVICGFIIEAKILNCTTDETCTATAAHAAGMAVVTFGNGGTTVSGCTNNATITGSVKADAFLAYALYEADVVEECTDNGTVVAG